MDIVFDQSFAVKVSEISMSIQSWSHQPVQGEDMPIKLSFKDIIFVMEDVDAASPIVHARTAKEEEPEEKPNKLKLQRQTSTGGAAAVAPVVSSEVIEVVKDSEKETKKSDADPTDTEIVMAMISSLADDTSTSKKVSLTPSLEPFSVVLTIAQHILVECLQVLFA
jgi:hypothetical protein